MTALHVVSVLCTKEVFDLRPVALIQNLKDIAS